MIPLRRWYEKKLETVLLASALTAILSVLTIAVFIFVEGFPILQKQGWKFLLGYEWAPLSGIFGIFPMIVGSIYVTAGALLLGVPIGVCCAIYLAEFSPPWFADLIRPAVLILEGIPSVVYGFFGVVVMVPFIMNHFGGWGFSLLAGSSASVNDPANHDWHYGRCITFCSPRIQRRFSSFGCYPFANHKNSGVAGGALRHFRGLGFKLGPSCR